MTREVRRIENHQLYYFSSCPYCIKVRIALWFMRIEIAMKNILSSPKYKDELISGGGKKQVPCLRIENENGETRWIYESTDIIRYFRSRNRLT